MTKPAEDQIADLQSQLAFQEDELEKMHNALYKQQQRVDALEMQLRHLSDQYKAMVDQPNNATASVEEKPPHY